MSQNTENFIIDKVDVAKIIIDTNTGARSLLSKRKFNVNEVISHFGWMVEFETPNYLTIQIGDKKHIELTPQFLECVNHSCEPNAFFDTKRKELVCLKPIKIGDEITFLYPSAEWDMDQPFKCLCGSKNCIGLVRGANYLTATQKNKYQFTHFIKQKLKS